MEEIVTFKKDNVTIALVKAPVTNAWGHLRGYTKNVGWKVDGARDYCLIYDTLLSKVSDKVLMKAFNDMVKEVRNGKIKFHAKARK